MSGVFEYPNTPGMDKPRVKEQPAGGSPPEQPTDATGRKIFDYSRSATPGAANRCTVHYLDGRTEVLHYPSLQAALAAGAYLNLRGARLDKVDLSTDQGRGLDLSRCSLRGAKLSGRYVGARFEGADLTAAQLSGDFRDANFTGAKLSASTEIREADLSFSVLTDVEGLEAAQLQDTKFDHAVGLGDIRDLNIAEAEQEETEPAEETDETEEIENYE